MSIVKDIIEALDGPTVVARETGIPVQTVWDWGRNGNIPHWRRDALVTLARRTGKTLSPDMVAYLASSEPAPKPAREAA